LGIRIAGQAENRHVYSSRSVIMSQTLMPFVAVLFAAFTTQPSAKADTFGTRNNEFTIDFVDIGNAARARRPAGPGGTKVAKLTSSAHHGPGCAWRSLQSDGGFSPARGESLQERRS
jgi:hypothetical protein